MTPARTLTAADIAAAQAKVEAAGWNQHMLRIREQLTTLQPRGQTTSQKVIKDFYALIQPALDAINTVATCGKGCSHCCHIPVRITEYEAELLAEATGRQMKYLSAKQAKRDPTQPGPCPFLQDGACAVYPVRPLICRIHYSVDDSAHWCDYSQGVKYPVAYVDRRPLELMFGAMLANFETVRGKRRAIHFQDIRQWFPTTTVPHRSGGPRGYMGDRGTAGPLGPTD